MHLPRFLLGCVILIEAQGGNFVVPPLPSGAEKDTANGSERTKRQPPLAAEVSAARGEQQDFHRLLKGGERRLQQEQQQQPLLAADGAGGASGPQVERIGAEVMVSGDGEGSVGTSLLPSVCPSEPFERYTALHRDIMYGKMDARYLVFRPYLYCGMGNRLNGFRGVMALAMMTDRALLVDWHGGIDPSSRETHKYEDNFLEAKGVPWDSFPLGLEGLDDDLEGLPADFTTEVWCQMPNAVGIRTPCDESRLTPNFLGTADWDEIYAADTQVVIVQAHNHNPMDLLRQNTESNVVRAIWKLDWDVSADVFGTCALRFLLKPRPDFKDRYCDERSAVLDGKIPSVALHVRTGDNPNYFPEWYETLPQDLENFVTCATGLEEGLAMVAAEYSTPGPDFDLFSIFKEGADSVWLLGTDSSTAINLLTESKRTVAQGGKVAYIEGDEFHRAHSGTKGGSASNNAGPIIDLALLSEAPLLVGSYCSTFSMNTAEIGGLPVPLRLFLSTPFHKILGKSDVVWDRFDDYRQGCRDLVSDPSARQDLRLALKSRLEPWIVCDDETG